MNATIARRMCALSVSSIWSAWIFAYILAEKSGIYMTQSVLNSSSFSLSHANICRLSAFLSALG